MFSFLNQTSYLATALVILVIAGGFLFSRGISPVRVGAFLLVILLLAAAQLLLRSGPTGVTTVQGAEALIESDRPVLVEFFSDY
ncbi:MAG: hypothetical protein HY685_01200 [Chloroflexi bacterium]|nr:hypothetical protein [Chloroflexota bacterium]